MQITTVVKGAWDAFATKITAFLPMLIGAIIIFVAGLLLARLFKYLTVKLLKLVRLDKAGEKTGLQEFLEKGNILKPPSEIVGSLVYWFMMILVLIASLDAKAAVPPFGSIRVMVPSSREKVSCHIRGPSEAMAKLKKMGFDLFVLSGDS